MKIIRTASDTAFKPTEKETLLRYDNYTRVAASQTAIMEKEPDSITELTEILGRDMKEVHSDLKLLEENNIVFFEEQGRKKPVIPYKDIKVDYSITNSLLTARR